MGKTHPGGRTKGGSKFDERPSPNRPDRHARGQRLVAAPAILRAQGAPMKIGFLTVKTGPLASGGIQMEQGLTLYLKERNNMLAGRPVQLFTGDSGGAPAVARTKMQEFVEKENIACLIGPLATRGSARDRRLHPRQAGAHAQRRRRRGHDPAQGQSLVRARDLVLGPMQLRHGRLRRQGAQATSAPP